MRQTPPFAYAEVDRSPDLMLCITLMDLLRDVPDVQAYRAEAVQLLNLQPSQRVLDLGCGTGDLSRTLAGFVAPDGEVIGLDASAAMLAEANQRQISSDVAVTFEQGDAANLRFEAGAFDACWTERMLCHVPDPGSVLREIARVLRLGGRALIVDVDTDGTMIDHPDLLTTSAFASIMAAQSPNRWIGRQLRRLLSEAGLKDVVVRPKVIELPFSVLEPTLAPLAAAVVAATEISPAVVDAWVQDLKAAHSAGTFFMAATVVVATATKG